MLHKTLLLPGILLGTLTLLSAQELPKDDLAKKPQWQRMLEGDDATAAAELQKKVNDSEQKDAYDSAIESAKALLAIRQRIQGQDHYETANAKVQLQVLSKISALSSAEREQWRQAVQSASQAKELESNLKYLEAIPIWEAAVKVSLKFLGDNHPTTAASYDGLATNLHAQGKHAEADSYFRKALAINRQSLGEAHPDTASSYDNLADNLKSQGKFLEAEPLMKNALAIRESSLGEEHFHIAASHNNLAFNLDGQSRFADAEPHFRKSLSIIQRVFGEVHPHTATSYNNLGINLNKLGKHAEADALYKKALAIRQKTLGENHPSVANIYNNMALNLNSQGKYAEAEPHLQRALAICKAVLGEDHPTTATSYNNAAFNLKSQGRHADAEPLYAKALTIRKNLFGEDHPATAQSYNNLAGSLDAQGKCLEAEPLYRKSLQIYQATLGNGHSETAIGYSGLANNLSGQGRHAEAEPILRWALEIMRNSLADDHPFVARSYSNLAVNLNTQHKSDEATALARKSLAIRELVLGKDHPETAHSYSVIAGILNSGGLYEEAEPLCRLAMTVREQSLGKDHPETADSYFEMAFNLNAQRRFTEAEPYYNRALSLYQRVLGEGHPETASAFTNLAFNLRAQNKLEETLAMLLRGLHSREASRLLAIGTGAARFTVSNSRNPYPLLSATQVRLKLPAVAFTSLESNLARGLLDELAIRRGARLTTDEERESVLLANRQAAIQPRISDLVTRHERSDLEKQELASLETERRLVLGQLNRFAVELSNREVATFTEIQNSLTADEAFVAWVDIAEKSGGVNEHWGCVLRGTKDPHFEPLPGRGESQRFTIDDDKLAEQCRDLLRQGTASKAEIVKLAKQLYDQRIAPLEKHLHGVKKLYVVAVNEMAGIPIEVLTDRYTISYVPSGTFLARLKDKAPPKSDGVLALGDPFYDVDTAQKPVPTELPPGGLLVEQVVPGGNAEKNGRVQSGDVLLSYAGVELKTVDGLAQEVANHANDKTVAVSIWREGEAKPVVRDFAPGKLGVALAREPAPQAIASRRQIDKLLTSRGGEWTDLPGTRLELKTLSELFAGKAIVLADHAASESQVEALRTGGQLGKFRYLHFASHGSANNIRAFDSALILAQDDPNTQEFAPSGEPWINGQITAREVLEHWKLDTELVTLSACQTGLGREGGGDGLLGFAQAFLLAGSRSVCLSLWEVDDRATALLMDRFYRNLLGKRDGLASPMPKASALAEAKAWLRNMTQEEVGLQLAGLTNSVSRAKNQRPLKIVAPTIDANANPRQVKPFDHPRFWAAFILIGDPN